MKRRKIYQRGTLVRRMHGRTWVWIARWREGTLERSKVLGRCSQMGKGEAETLLAGIVKPFNDGIAAPVEIWTFRGWVERSYFPNAERYWKASTRSTAEDRIRHHLIPHFGDKLMKNITRQNMQDFLDGLAASLGRGMLSHLRWDLSGIYKLAMADGLVSHNPAAVLRVPAAAAEPGHVRPLTAEEVRTVFENVETRERIIARLAIIEGMRPGEILALQWQDIRGNLCVISRRVYRNQVDKPKTGRGREIALSDGTARALAAWRKEAIDPRPEGWVFPSAAMTPLARDNTQRRYIQRPLEKFGLGWVTFQAMRSTNASLMAKFGVDPKVGADQRGHGLGVSMEVYTSSDAQQKRQAVRKLEQAIEGRKKGRKSPIRGKSGNKKPPNAAK